jgi:hypothetical protein
MAMRSQLYEWTGTNKFTPDNQSSIFIGGTGNNITKPAETTATQFVVIEQVASTGSNPGGAAANSYSSTAANDGAQMYAQVRINTTDYFLDPDNKPNDGIPGSASPYPRLLTMQPSFNLYPDIYVLPGQVWDVLVTQRGLAVAVTNTALQAFVKYTLYDGPDALIANKLLELGISVSPANVDWYKRSLIQQQSSVVGGV